MAVKNDAKIRVYTSLSGNDTDSFLSSVYDSPGVGSPGSAIHYMSLIDQG